MTKKRDLTPEQEKYLHEELSLAHVEFHEMLIHWGARAANPTAVGTVFCSGLLSNLRTMLTKEDYDFTVRRILETVEELTQQDQGETHDPDRRSTVH